MNNINYKLLFDVMIRVAREKNLHQNIINELRLHRYNCSFEDQDEIKFKNLKFLDFLNEYNIDNHIINVHVLKNKLIKIYNIKTKRNEFILFDYIIISQFNIYLIQCKNFYENEVSINQMHHLTINDSTINNFKDNHNYYKSFIIEIFKNGMFKDNHNFLPNIKFCTILNDEVSISDENKKIFASNNILLESELKNKLENDIIKYYKKIFNFLNLKKEFDNNSNSLLPELFNKIMVDANLKNKYLKSKKLISELNIDKDLIEHFFKNIKLNKTLESNIINDIKHLFLRHEDKMNLENFISINGLNEYVNFVLTLYNHRINNTQSDLNIINRINNLIDKSLKDNIIINNKTEDKDKINLKLYSISGSFIYNNKEEKFSIILNRYNFDQMQKIIKLIIFEKENKNFKINPLAIPSIKLIKENEYYLLTFGNENPNASDFKINNLYFRDDKNEYYFLKINNSASNTVFENTLKAIIYDNVHKFYTNKDGVDLHKIIILKPLY